MKCNRVPVFASLALLLGCLAPTAQADLSYDYVELEGVPYLRSIPIPVTIPINLVLSEKRTIEFDGWSVRGRVSHEISKRFHVFSTYSFRESSSSDLTIIDGTLSARGDLSIHSLGAGAGFHTPVGEATSLYFDFGFLYNRATIDGQIRFDVGTGPMTVPVGNTSNNFGFAGTAGIRHMQTGKLELFGSMTAEAPDVTSRNFIYFDLGTRYDFTKWLSASTTLQLGTDGHVGVVLGLRVYYDELLRGREDHG